MNTVWQLGSTLSLKLSPHYFYSVSFFSSIKESIKNLAAQFVAQAADEADTAASIFATEVEDSRIIAMEEILENYLNYIMIQE